MVAMKDDKVIAVIGGAYRAGLDSLKATLEGR